MLGQGKHKTAPKSCVNTDRNMTWSKPQKWLHIPLSWPILVAATSLSIIAFALFLSSYLLGKNYWYPHQISSTSWYHPIQSKAYVTRTSAHLILIHAAVLQRVLSNTLFLRCFMLPDCTLTHCNESQNPAWFSNTCVPGDLGLKGMVKR